MSDAAQRRTLWFLVPDQSGTAILTGPHGGLPRVDIELADGETTVTAAARVAQTRWGVALPVVELLFDLSALDDSPSMLDALIEVAPPPVGWQPPDDSNWTAISAAEPSVAPGLAPRVGELLAERRHERVPDPRRSRWSRPGWYDSAREWIDTTLHDAGWGAATSVVQVRHWGISALMRATSDGGTAWFKAVFPGFRQEPGITEFLHQQEPGLVAPVLGADTDAGWLLLADVGTTFVSGDLGQSGTAIERLVDAQRRFLGRTEDLVTAGCPTRRLGDLGDALEAVLLDADVVSWLTVTPERAAAVVDWVRVAAGAIDELGIPDTLVHGDFHPGNVALVDEEAIIIDWSDAAVSNPLIDVLTWIEWTKDDAELTAAVWQMFLDAWDGVVDVERFLAHREHFVGLGGAYHAISYAGILAGLEPCHCPQHADGLSSFFARLDAAVPR